MPRKTKIKYDEERINKFVDNYKWPSVPLDHTTGILSLITCDSWNDRALMAMGCIKEANAAFDKKMQNLKGKRLQKCAPAIIMHRKTLASQADKLNAILRLHMYDDLVRTVLSFLDLDNEKFTVFTKLSDPEKTEEKRRYAISRRFRKSSAKGKQIR